MEIAEYITISELALLFNKSFVDIISGFMQLGIMVSINHRLDEEMIKAISESFGYEVEIIKSEFTEEQKENINFRNRIAMSGDFIYKQK